MTRRSSTRSLPRTSVGKNGLIFCHCSSLSQNKVLLMMIPCSLSTENHYPIQPSTVLLSFDPSSITFSLNGKTQTLSVAPETPLLYVLRNDLELNGAKFGCGLAQCGACTVIADGAAIRSCITPLGDVAGREVTTIEGLGTARGGSHDGRRARPQRRPAPRMPAGSSIPTGSGTRWRVVSCNPRAGRARSRSSSTASAS